MAPLTLMILASVLKLHGPDTSILNGHNGIDLLLSEVRGQLGEQGSSPALQPGAKRARFADQKQAKKVNEDEKKEEKADDDLKLERPLSGRGNSRKYIKDKNSKGF
jgi:hypothetical protein